jgi:antitoxin component YwqK of YwqJK toxin-antitoxin module
MTPKSCLFCFLFLFLVVSPGIAQENNFTIKSDARNGILDGKKEGKWMELLDINSQVTKDPGAPLYRLGIYVHDTLNGLVRIYKTDGTLMQELIYSGGHKNGLCREYFPNGKLETIMPMINDTLDGIWTEYFDNGIIHTESPWVMGVQSGLEKEYDTHGNLITETLYTKGNPGVSRDVKGPDPEQLTFETIQPAGNGYHKLYLDEHDSLVPDKSKASCYRVIYYEQGVPEGTCVTYSLNGNRNREVCYAHGTLHGMARWYYPKGELKEMASFVNGKKEGRAIVYFKNGQISRITSFTNGKLNGKDITWYENGKLKSTSLYKNGEVQSSLKYTEKGELIH